MNTRRAQTGIRRSGTRPASAVDYMSPMSRRAIVRLVVLITAAAALTAAYAMDHARTDQAQQAITSHK